MQQFPGHGCGVEYANIDDVKRPHRKPTPRVGNTR